MDELVRELHDKAPCRMLFGDDIVLGNEIKESLRKELDTEGYVRKKEF